MATFHERLEKALSQAGRSFYWLQTDVGIPSSKSTGWKNGTRKPTHADLRRIASAKGLNLSFEDLKAWAFEEKFGRDAFQAIARQFLKEEAPDLLEQYDRRASAEARAEAS